MTTECEIWHDNRSATWSFPRLWTFSDPQIPLTSHFPNVAGAGLFRFFDGSLLKVNLTVGGDCIDFAANGAHCTLIFQATGGTGRFERASCGSARPRRG
jgi:hypothetical protein